MIRPIIAPAIHNHRIVIPETRYARSGEASIAYQVSGDGPLDLVFNPGFVTHLEATWEEPRLAHFLFRLASFSRVLLFDKRGTRLSDPVDRPTTVEERMDDIRAVMDSAGSDRAALLGISEGGPLCVLFAVSHPGRTAALVLHSSYARLLRDDDYPWGWSPQFFEAFLAALDRVYSGDSHVVEQANPSVIGDGRYQAWWRHYLRISASPAMARALMQMRAEIDVRDQLAQVSVPTLLLHRVDERWVDVGQSRYLAAHIPGAKLVELPGADHRPWLGDAETVLHEIERFLTGSVRRPRRALWQAGPQALSRREREVVRLALAGERAADIARQLFVSERTVESHLASAYAKLGVRSRVELARRADEFGL